jgi:hypothetical protein
MNTAKKLREKSMHRTWALRSAPSRSKAQAAKLSRPKELRMIWLDRLDAFERDELTVIIETPKRSQNKYAYEPRFGTFVLDGGLPAGAVFPFDFGFVPATIGEDGYFLDVLVLMDAAAFTGRMVTSRLIGVIGAEKRRIIRPFATTV